MQENIKKQITLYSDGSSLGNPGPAGYGGILEYQGNQKRYSGGKIYSTNNRMELLGVIEGLKLLKEPCYVEVISDSTYVVNAINKWLNNWIKKDFKEIKNIDLWKEYIYVSSTHNIKAIWIKGHSGHIQNEECDDMARDEANRQKLLI